MKFFMEEMTLWQAIILGLTQGLAEFLPVSSSGHLVLVRELFGIDGEYLLFDVMLHVGTLFAVFLAFFKDLIALFKPPFRTIGLIIIATVPAVVVGLLAGDYIESLFSSGKYLCFFFLFTALLMFLTEIIAKRTRETKPLGLKAAVFMGLMQGVGVFPGISRSGSTIFGGVAARLDRETAAKFSFMMSAPAIVGGLVSEGLDVLKEGVSIGPDLPAILVGMVVAGVSGYLAIRFFLRLISRVSLNGFAVYVAVLGIVVIILQAMGVITDAPAPVAEVAAAAKAVSGL